MPVEAKYTLTHKAALLVMISAAFPATAVAATVGRVDFAIGGVTATGAAGPARKLVRGENISDGELISTNDGRAQIRFTDGAYMSLLPQTDFRVDEYNYAGRADGSERGIFSLLKGGLRTITGFIGRSNRQSYQLKTAVATIGIRGTEYTVAYTGSITASVTGGIINLANAGGSLDVSSGESAHVIDFNTAPTLIALKPDLGGPPSVPQPRIDPPPNPFITPTPSIISPPPSDSTSPPPIDGGSPPTFVDSQIRPMAFAHNGGGGAHVDLYQSTRVDFDATSRVISFVDGSSPNTWSGSYADTHDDGIIAWGRWTSGVVGGDGNHSGLSLTGSNQSLHYVVGSPTSVMPTTGSAIYTLLGGTAPTADSGAIGVLTGGALMANFSMGKVDLNLTFTMSGNSYVTHASNMAISSSTFGTTGQNPGSTSSSGPCSSGCVTDIKGFFAGSAAERAGLGYSFVNQTAGKTVGTAGFASSGRN